MKKRTRHFVLVCVLLGTLLKSLPQFHHHQEAHACTQIDGSFFYIEGPPASTHGTQVVGVRHGDQHEHETCGLCHIVPYTFASLDGSCITRRGEAYSSPCFDSDHFETQLDLQGPRGPPVCS